MLYPTIDELTKGKFNRYELSLAAAKCARIVTDEYCQQKEDAEKAIEILKANGEDAYVLGEIVKSDEGVILL